MRVTALSGGVGGAKLVKGLYQLDSLEDLSIIGNTGDDIDIFGLRISPDLDIVMYTLAEIVNPSQGWGVKNDSFHCLESLHSLYQQENWFNIGDRDLATHILRTQLLNEGITLSSVTRRLCDALGLSNVSLIPMSDDRVETHVKIEDGSIIHFEEYFVKRQCADTPVEFFYIGAEAARPTQQAIEAIRNTDIIILTPSNPIASIEPILSIPGYREEMKKASCPIIGVSPLIGGKALKGPAEQFMTAKGFQSNAQGVAEYYSGLLTHFVIDTIDMHLKKSIEALGISVSVTNTIMNTRQEKIALAEHILSLRN